jgi:proteasome beta subunit
VTVVLSLVCSDGIVMAADTQVTEKDRGVSYPARKLHLLGDRGAWGGSGARSVLLELERLFESSPSAILEAEDPGRALQERVLPVLQHHYDHFIVDVPGEDGGGTPSTYVMAASYVGDEPWIVEINPHAMVSRYEDVGFHAIGSGAPMAQQAGALLANFRMAKRPVDYGVVAIVRVLDALAQTSPSVGGPLDVVRIMPDGTERLDDKAIDRARKQVDRWVELEQEALDRLLE